MNCPGGQIIDAQSRKGLRREGIHARNCCLYLGLHHERTLPCPFECLAKPGAAVNKFDHNRTLLNNQVTNNQVTDRTLPRLYVIASKRSVQSPGFVSMPVRYSRGLMPRMAKKPSVSRLRGLSPEGIDDLHPLGLDYLCHGERGRIAYPEGRNAAGRDWVALPSSASTGAPIRSGSRRRATSVHATTEFRPPAGSDWRKRYADGAGQYR
jgi:hypothetical protein